MLDDFQIFAVELYIFVFILNENCLVYQLLEKFIQQLRKQSWKTSTVFIIAFLLKKKISSQNYFNRSYSFLRYSPLTQYAMRESILEMR